MPQEMTGYPSLDKPWLKYYSREVLEAPLPECTMYDYIYQNNKDYSDHTALNYFGRKITFGDFFANINKTAAALSASGVKTGDIVTVISVCTPETLYLFYALNRLGAVSNMVDPRISVGGLRQYIAEVHSKVVFTIDAALEKVVDAVRDTEAEKIVVLSPYTSLPSAMALLANLAQVFKKTPKLSANCVSWKAFLSKGKNHSPAYPAYERDRCCVIVHTGGTTGSPKGVMLSNENLNGAVLQCIHCGIDLKREHTWLAIMPPFIAYGVGNGIHVPLVVGMETILIPQFKPEEYAELMLKYRPNHMVGAPSHYQHLIFNEKLARSDLSYVIAPMVGGDRMKPDMEEETNRFLQEHHCSYHVMKGYGMTEVCAAVTLTISNEINPIGSVGIPFSHTVISIFDPETGEELPYYQQGEVCTTGPNTMLGYYNNPDATADILRTHKDGKQWIHSGDIGYMDENGCLFIVDRIKRMIIRFDGFKVFPSQVEQVLSANGSVNDCCVVGKPDKSQSHGMLPVAFVRLKDGANEQTVKQELISACETELPEYAQPSDFMFVEELPLTPIGKADYRKLEELAAERS